MARLVYKAFASIYKNVYKAPPTGFSAFPVDPPRADSRDMSQPYAHRAEIERLDQRPVRPCAQRGPITIAGRQGSEVSLWYENDAMVFCETKPKCRFNIARAARVAGAYGSAGTAVDEGFGSDRC